MPSQRKTSKTTTLVTTGLVLAALVLGGAGTAVAAPVTYTVSISWSAGGGYTTSPYPPGWACTFENPSWAGPGVEIRCRAPENVCRNPSVAGAVTGLTDANIGVVGICQEDISHGGLPDLRTSCVRGTGGPPAGCTATTPGLINTTHDLSLICHAHAGGAPTYWTAACSWTLGT